MTPSCSPTTCRDLAERYLETFRSMHPHTNPPSVVVMRDGSVLFNGYVVSATDLAEMQANLLRWHAPPAPLARAS